MKKIDIINFVETNILSLNYKDNNYLYFISTYLSSLDDKSNIKDFMRDIKRSISYLEGLFDEVFLLVSSDFDKKLFVETENKNLINCLEFLVNLLGENDFISEADRLNKIKTKISLGYDRYFIQGDKLVVWFSSNDLEFDVYSKIDLDSEVSVLRILDNYLDLKKILEFNKFTKYLEKFPSNIYRNLNLNLIDIRKSLFFDENFEMEEFSKGKIKVCDFESFEVAIKCLEIFNLEDN
jgi:hypothetical protein